MTSRSPGDDLRRGDDAALAVADHRRRRGGHLPQARDRRLGARFLDVAEDGVRDDDREDRERLIWGRAPALDQPHHERDRGGEDEQQHERAFELREKAPPGRRRCRRSQLVAPDFGEATARLRRGETAREVGAEPFGDCRGGNGVGGVGKEWGRHADDCVLEILTTG